jgi:peptidoglycan/LPS O-acetylase OafA/YrhL
VVVSHLVNYRYSPLPAGQMPSMLAGQLGTLGVSIFFVISGFVIARLAFQERELTGSFSAKRFYIRRFFRIVPPFFLYLACLHLFSMAGWIRQSPWDTAVAAVFACNIGALNCGWFAGHSWSLAYEEQFYIVFPLIVALAGTRSRAFVSMLLPLVVALCVIHLFVTNLGILGSTLVNYSFAVVFITAGTFYAANEATLRRLCATRAAPALALASFLIVFGPLLPASFPSSGFFAAAYFMCLVPLAAGWMVTYSSFHEGIVAKVLRTWVLQFLGLISYSLYIWQQAFDAHPSLYLEWSLLMIAPLMLALATASYYFVERPAGKLGKRFRAAKGSVP